MFLPEYVADDLAFAFRCYVYFRWHTYCCQPVAVLPRLAPDHFQAIHPKIRVLELTRSETQIALLASLQPNDSVSVAASKLKGAASRSIRTLLGLTCPEKILGGGYFAATTGDNTSAELDRYLERQGAHHGYDQRANPPVWVQEWPLSEPDLAALQTPHAATVLHWHLVYSTWNRQGVFTRQAGEALCRLWAGRTSDWRIRLRKVSVLPDHVHIALWAHPTVVPAKLALDMLNASQTLMRDEYARLLIQAAIPRLWKPSAYIGSYGDITKAHVRNYLRSWDCGHLA